MIRPKKQGQEGFAGSRINPTLVEYLSISEQLWGTLRIDVGLFNFEITITHWTIELMDRFLSTVPQYVGLKLKSDHDKVKVLTQTKEEIGDEDVDEKDLKSAPVWVKLHVVSITAFTEDGLSVISTKLGTSFMLDTYTASMCMESLGWSSFGRAMIDLHADVELKDTLVVSLTCKVFDHSLDQYSKKIVSDVNVKTQRQVVRGLPVGPKSRVMTTTVVNNSVFRGFFKKQKLFGPNFVDWYRQLCIVLSAEDKLNYLELLIPATPVPAVAGQQVPAETLAAHVAWVKGQKKISLLMLMTMEPDLQQNLETLGAYDMLKELKTLFAQQAEQKLLQTVREFHACKQEEGQYLNSYILKMKGYIDNLERLGYPLSLSLAVSLILISLRKEYDSFVQNYNMHSMGKRVNELHDMLKLHKKTLPKRDAPALHAIRAEKVQKKNKNKKPQLAVKGNNKWKGKSKLAYAPKPKIPPPPKKKDPAKDSGFRRSRKLKPRALSLYMGNGQRAAVKAIGSYDLCFPSGLVLVLHNCHYAPSLTRGVISVSRLYDDGFINRFENDNSILVFKDNLIYFNAVPRDGNFKIVLSDSNANVSSMYVVSNKRAKLNLDSSRSMAHVVLDTLARTYLISRKPNSRRHKIATFVRGANILSQEFLDHLKLHDESTTLQKSFWDYARSLVVRSLNMVQLRRLKKTPFGSMVHKGHDMLQIPNVFKLRGGEYELGDLNEPANYKAALSDLEFDKWLNAMNVEMQSMKDNEVWDLVDLPPNGKTVRSKWLFKKKTDMDGAVHTYKSSSCSEGLHSNSRD
ncbi:hypothetical protein Tco_0570818 [Tanacetum coccineum]